MRKKQISVNELTLGMYVVELDRPWLETSLPFQGFPITSADQIVQLKKYCRSVYIDEELNPASATTAEKKPVGQPLVRGSVVYKEMVSFDKELPAAQEIYWDCEKSVQDTLAAISKTGELNPEQMQVAVGKMTRSIERNPDAMILLHKMKQKNNTAFTRAVDNSLHMITFGRFLQFPSDRLELLGLAGLMLDIGKVHLPEPILAKEGRLTADEYEQSKTHVMYSVKLIGEALSLPSGLANIVIQHHERIDGSGYPHGLSGSEISIDGAIAGLVDSYCALISRRSYADQESPSNALNILYKLRGTLYHEALAEQFIQCVGIYPVGSAVELNSGEIGIVIGQNLIRRLQPKVMLILDKARSPISHTILDLIKDPATPSGEPYRIRKTIPISQLPIKTEDFFL